MTDEAKIREMEKNMARDAEEIRLLRGRVMELEEWLAMAEAQAQLCESQSLDEVRTLAIKLFKAGQKEKRNQQACDPDLTELGRGQDHPSGVIREQVPP